MRRLGLGCAALFSSLLGGCICPSLYSGGEIKIAPDGRSVVVQLKEEGIAFDAASGAELARYPHVSGMAFSPDGRYFATGSYGSVTVWDVREHTRVSEFRSARYEAGHLAFSPDGRWLAAGGVRTIWIWDLTHDARETKVYAHPGGIYGLAFTPDGTALASAGAEGIVRFTDPQDGHELHHIDVRPYSALSIAFAPDGRTLAVGQWKTVRIIDLETGSDVRRLRGPDSGVHELAFSPDGRELLGRSSMATLRRWDVKTGARLRPPPNPDIAFAMTSTPDRSVAAFLFWKKVVVWDMAVQKKRSAFKVPSPW